MEEIVSSNTKKCSHRVPIYMSIQPDSTKGGVCATCKLSMAYRERAGVGDRCAPSMSSGSIVGLHCVYSSNNPQALKVKLSGNNTISKFDQV